MKSRARIPQVTLLLAIAGATLFAFSSAKQGEALGRYDSEHHLAGLDLESAYRERALSQIVAEKSGDPRVRRFAEAWATGAESVLAGTAGDDTVLGAGYFGSDAEAALKANAERGLDLAYLDLLRTTHEERLNLMKTAADETDQPQVRMLAVESIPRLQDELRSIHRLAVNLD